MTSAAAHRRVGRQLRGAIKHGYHIKRHVFTPQDFDRPVLDLSAHGRQVPRQLFFGRRLLRLAATARAPMHRPTTEMSRAAVLS